jgi:hypothetical protein
MFVKLLLSFFLIIIISQSHDPIQDRIQGPAKADFTYNSHVETTSDSKLEIVNFITNNADSPLAVKWDDGGIFFYGFAQLKPKGMQSKKSIAQEPYIYDHSEIKYGNSLQYSADVRCYLDGQARPKDRTRTEVTQQDGKGEEIFKIEVMSEISQDGHSASIDFSIKGNLSLILPSRVGPELKTISKGGEWEIIKTPSLNGLDIQDEDRKTILRWLDKTPMPKHTNAAPDFVVLLNKTGRGNKISLPLTGDNWGLDQIYVIAYMPDTPGVMGFTADIYLPE